jgi:hypothetical protein
MTFKELFIDFISGTPIKRKPWGGYWIYNSKENDIVIHAKDGEQIYFSNVEDLPFTISNILQDDWEVATNENCDIEVK